MTAGTTDLTIEAYTAYTLELSAQDASGNPVDISVCTAKAAIRKTPSDATELTHFTCSISANTVSLLINETQTAALAASNASSKWDCYIVWPTGHTNKLRGGSLTIIPSITRPLP